MYLLRDPSYPHCMIEYGTKPKVVPINAYFISWSDLIMCQLDVFKFPKNVNKSGLEYTKIDQT